MRDKDLVSVFYMWIFSFPYNICFGLVWFLFMIFIAVLGMGILWHLQKFLKYIYYFILEFTPSTILHHPPSPAVPGIVSTDIVFAFPYICTQYLHNIHPPLPFSHLLSPPTGTTLPPPNRTCSALLFYNFVYSPSYLPAFTLPLLYVTSLSMTCFS
jgi:hypothetical protein